MDNINFTNEEIWDFLKNKMSKNGFVPKASIVNTHIDDYPNNKVEITKVYYEDDVHNAIAVAYRSGYERCMKGRPFKIGEKKKEKKKGGHWEPVDPNNLPKEGTKVRYVESRGHVFGLYDGDTGTVVSGLGFSVNMNRINLVIHTSKIIGKYFDMWVEDDE